MASAVRVVLVALVLASVLVLRAASPAAAAATTITGTVFEDYNSNNVMNTTSAQGVAIDRGVGGIAVRAFGAGGAYLSGTTTATNGTYTLDVTAANGAMVRVEFGIPDTAAYEGYRPGYVIGTNNASGSSLNTTVQFAKAGDSGVNLALVKPGEYCANRPSLVTCAFDLKTGSASNVGAFTISSNPNGFVDVTPNSTRIGSSAQLGAVWGIGVDRSRNTFYGTYVKRHVEYGQAGAVNAIYRINLDAPGTVTTFVTLPGTLPQHDPTSPGGVYTTYADDRVVFEKVGRVGLGDVDVTSDGRTLLAVDMDETAPKLWFVPIVGTGNAVTAGTPVSLAIPKPSTFRSVPCPGNWHPMGLGVRGSRILVGGVCGAENTVSTSTPRGTNPTSATAFVLEYSGATDASGSFITIWADTLSYQRSCTYTEGTRIPCNSSTSTVGSISSADWAAWNEYPNLFAIDGPSGALFGSNPQPMLSNIEIADNGDLVLGFRDRYHDQIVIGQPAWSKAYTDSVVDPPLPWPTWASGMAGGDIRRVCNSGGVLSTETGGSCPTLWGSGSIDASGTHEYYVDNFYPWGAAHSETMTGSLTSLPGYAGVWGSVYDVTGPGQQGVMSWGECQASPNPATCRGSATGFGTQIAGSGFGNLNGFNKGQGLADLEVICDAAPVQIGNRVWIDTNRDGIQDPDEAPVAGVMVRLYDTAGTLVSTAVTDAKGQYLFSSAAGNDEPADGGPNPDPWGGNLRADTAYVIKLDRPSDFAAGGPLAGYWPTRTGGTPASSASIATIADNNAVLGATGTTYGVDRFPEMTVAPRAPGNNDHTFDAGFVAAVSVGNRVWNDVNRDGLQTAGEPGIAGVTLSITTADGSAVADIWGNPVTTTTTDANGNYVFANLPPGRYRVSVVDPVGYWPTTAGAGSDPTMDSSTRSATSSDLQSAGASDTSLDFGFVSPAVSVGDRVWSDQDADGVQDAGEPGIAGVTMSITNSDGSPVTDVFGDPVTTTTTDANGNYVFANLPPGSYRVSAATPTGFDPTLSGQGTSTTDSSTGSAVSANLTTNGASDTSLDFGFVPRRVSVGNRVWIDVDRDGVQDAGEPGISGVTLSITNADGSPVTDVFGDPVTTTTTDANGNYVFANLPVGQYRVSVIDPTGFIPTAAGLGTAGVDSSTGSALSANLTTNGAADMSLDFGFVVPSVSVGSRVWIDGNRDGLQTFGEPGIAGVTLSITNADGSPVTDVFGNPVTTTTTDANGNYVFTDLPVGRYRVTVVDPPGYTATQSGVGTDRALDSSIGSATSADLTTEGATDRTLDFGYVLSAVSVGDLVWNDLDADGIQDAGEPGIAGVVLTITRADGSPVTDVYGDPVTTTVTDVDGRYVFDNLPIGTYRVTVTPPDGFSATAGGQGPDATADSSDGSATSAALSSDGQSDLTLDFGFVTTAVSVGDRVWLDIDRDGIQDVGEPGIAGVTLTIAYVDGTAVTDVHGTPVTTTTTDDSGHYAFVDLPPGTYVVTVTPPPGLLPTVDGAGSDPALDSSRNFATSEALLTDDAWDRTLDFGFVVPEVSVGDLVWLDRDRDGVQDAGEPGIPRVTLSITNADGSPVTDVFGDPVSTTTTDANGNYVFDHLPLGTYTVTVVDPAGYLPTIAGAGGSATDSSTRTATSRTLVAAGQSDMTLDFGYIVPLVEVAPIIWQDTNANGVVDPGEPGLAGVSVDITNPDGTLVYDGLGAPVTTALTDTSGRARFTSLPTGRYSLRASLPPGWNPTAGCPTCDPTTGVAISADLTGNGDVDLSPGFGLVAPVASTTTTPAPSPAADLPCPECVPTDPPADEPCLVCIGALPMTGSDSSLLVLAGAVLLVGGATLVFLRRRAGRER